VVLGNEAADLDSVVCAVVHAYFLSKRGEVAVPVINCRRAHLPLRGEVIPALLDAGIESPAEMLVFADDGAGEDEGAALARLAEQQRLSIALVDHNALAEHQAHFVQSVDSVLDHHADTGAFAAASPRVVVATGSCATLVAEVHLEALLSEPGLARLVRSTVLLDTGCMAPELAKGTARDQAILDALRDAAGGGDSASDRATYDRLLRQRVDVAALSVDLLLLKDVKFGVAVAPAEAENSKVRFAVCAVPTALDSHSWDAWRAAVEGFAAERKLDLVLLMTTVTREGSFRRELAAFSRPSPSSCLLDALFVAHEASFAQLLRLESKADVHFNEVSTSSWVGRAFDQHAIEMSRKQLWPALVAALERVYVRGAATSSRM
jgi:inorganic pyrophosphatase/exopolyphosphatase